MLLSAPMFSIEEWYRAKAGSFGYLCWEQEITLSTTESMPGCTGAWFYSSYV